MCYLRDVLVTRAHKDPQLTAFMACWAYEEHWHGDAIARVLDAHDEPSGGVRLEALRRRLSRRDGVRPLLFSVGSALTRHLPAVHMAWGAVNEWSTQAGYGRLAAKAAVPAVAWLAVTAVTVAVTSDRPGTGARPLRTVDLVLEFTWLASTAIAVLLGAVLAWRALAGTELTGTVIRTLRIAAAVAATAMAAGLIATGIEASLLRAYAPALIGTGWLAFIGAGMLAADTRMCRAGPHPDGDPHGTSVQGQPGQRPLTSVGRGLEGSGTGASRLAGWSGLPRSGARRGHAGSSESRSGAVWAG